MLRERPHFPLQLITGELPPDPSLEEGELLQISAQRFGDSSEPSDKL